MNAGSLTENVLNLPKEQRAFLAERLLESLDYDEEFPISSSWRDEAIRRSNELKDGQVKLLDGEEVFDEVAKALG